MKLHFDAQQAYQLDAIHAVVDLFAGQPAAAGTFEWQTNALEPELLDSLGTSASVRAPGRACPAQRAG